MPTFRTGRSGSISDSVRNLVSGDPGVTAADEMAIDQAVATTQHRQSLAEKVRLEADALRRAEQERRDPELATEYASRASGLDPALAKRYESWRTNPVVPASVATDELGGPMPDITQVSPLDPDQARAYNAARASLLANRLATGKTNAQQLTGAGGNLLVQRFRDEMTQPGISIGRENQLGHAANIKAREPFKTNAQGTVLNEETGALGEDSDLAAVVRKNVEAQAAERGAAAGLSSTRAGDITATQPSRIELNTARADVARNPRARPAPNRTPGQEARDNAYGDVARERAAAAAEARVRREQTAARQQYARDPKMKASGTKLGKWVNGQGFEVLDKAGKHIGYYIADS